MNRTIFLLRQPLLALVLLLGLRTGSARTSNGLLIAWRWILTLCLLLVGLQSRSQVPDWQMAVASGGGNSLSYATAADASGNVYIAGQFSGTATFGSTSLTSAGSTDAFVAKWSNSTGDFVWALRAGGASTDEANGVAVSGTSVYIVGDQSGAVSFGSIALTGAGSRDGFVARLTDAGNSASFDWAQVLGGTGFDYAKAVTAVGNSVYVAGGFAGAGMTVGSTTLTNAGAATSLDMYVARLANTGACTWAVRAGGTGSDFANAVAVNATGEVYVAGGFSGSNSAFGSTTLASTGGQDMYVARLTDYGSGAYFAWAKSGGSSGSSGTDVVDALAVNGSAV